MKYYVHNGGDATLQLAVSELERYLGKIASTVLKPAEREADADFILAAPMLEHSKWDDSILVRSRGKQLIMTGSNPRSVLFAVYDYLEELGCRWPDPVTEILPEHAEIRLENLDRLQHASSRYRGLSPFMEDDSPLSEKRLFDLLAWMPKKKYNLYFQEGFTPECPGDKWSVKNGERPLQHVEYNCRGWSRERRAAWMETRGRAIDFARERGLLIERYGHGWAAGIVEHYAAAKSLPLEEARAFLAAKGRVTKLGDIASPMWFQFCMSAPGLKELYIEHVVEYLQERHGEADIAAIWLGDGYDNACQCAECVKKPFSDWFMEIFAEVASRLKKTFPELRLEGLVYFMTLEPPRAAWPELPDNADFIIAPWNRCYRHALDSEECRFPDWEPDFRFNRSHVAEKGLRPLNNDLGKAIRGWKESVPGFKSRMFEYFCLNGAPGRHRLAYDASSLARDIRDFPRLGLEGCVSCEPADFVDTPFYLMHNVSAALMWNPGADEAKIRRELIQQFYPDRTQARMIAAAADEVNRLLLEWDEHLPAGEDLLAGLRSIQAGLPDAPLFQFDLLRMQCAIAAGMPDCKPIREHEEIIAMLSEKRGFFERYFDCDVLLEKYAGECMKIKTSADCSEE